MGWRTIYIEEGHKVSLYLNNLKIEDSDETYIVPISDIDTVIFNNYKLFRILFKKHFGDTPMKVRKHIVEQD